MILKQRKASLMCRILRVNPIQSLPPCLPPRKSSSPFASRQAYHLSLSPVLPPLSGGPKAEGEEEETVRETDGGKGDIRRRSPNKAGPRPKELSPMGNPTNLAPERKASEECLLLLLLCAEIPAAKAPTRKRSERKKKVWFRKEEGRGLASM